MFVFLSMNTDLDTGPDKCPGSGNGTVGGNHRRIRPGTEDQRGTSGLHSGSWDPQASPAAI